MAQNKIILLLGTNLGDKYQNIKISKILIEKEIGHIKSESNILENKAEDFSSNNLFLNQKIELYTYLSPFDLLKKIKKIEYNMGRVYTKPLKNEKYTDRLIDIDILFFNSISLESKHLVIPHKQIYFRNFIKKLIFF